MKKEEIFETVLPAGVTIRKAVKYFMEFLMEHHLGHTIVLDYKSMNCKEPLLLIIGRDISPNTTAPEYHPDIAFGWKGRDMESHIYIQASDLNDPDAPVLDQLMVNVNGAIYAIDENGGLVFIDGKSYQKDSMHSLSPDDWAVTILIDEKLTVIRKAAIDFYGLHHPEEGDTSEE